jgi:hypothetical protein
MRARLAKMAAAVMLPLALSSCFITPGAFGSTLDLRKDGTFAFSYKGEVVFMSPDALMKMGENPEDAVWKDDKATCYKESTSAGPGDAASDAARVSDAASNAMVAAAGNAAASADNAAEAVDAAAAATEAVDDNSRPCTPKEIAEQKKDWEEAKKAREDKAKKDSAQFGAIFGYTPGDDAANKKLAATMMKFEGWKSVVYKGDGVFAIDYVASGRLDHDFVFPLFPQSDLVFPFVTVKRQANGAVRVSAPALIGGGLKALAARMKGIGAAMTDKEVPQSTKTKGSFTVTTDGEIVTNNTEDGPDRVATGRQLVWEIGPESEKVPEALIRLK